MHSLGRLRINKFWPLLLLPALLLPVLNTFPYPSAQSEFSDITITHTPYTLFLRQAILTDHQIPLWNPAIFSGSPFFANPLSGLYYPPGWLALILPIPLGFNLLVLVHLLCGGLGVYKLLRQQGLHQQAAILGGLAFAALPKLFAHYGAGHLTLLYAIPWTPWLLWAEARSGEEAARPPWAQPGLILAITFLADVRWALLAGLLWLGFAIQKRSAWGHLASQISLAGLLSAPLALPLLEFTRLATRASLSSGDVFTYSLPPERLLGLFIPDFGGFHEYTLYAGEFVLALALVTLAAKSIRVRARFWWIVAGLSILFALGPATPFFAGLAWLPGFNLLRVPSRALFLCGLSIAVLSAYALDGVLEALPAAERRPVNLALVALAALTAGLAGLIAAASGRLAFNIAWGGGAVILAAVWVGLGVNQRLSRQTWLILLFVFTMLDLGVFDRQAFAPRSVQAVQSEGLPAVSFLAQQPGVFRVYSPSYSLPQQTARQAGLEIADGVDPLQLSSYVAFMSTASGVPQPGYSVTMPPFATGDPAVDNAAYHPNPQSLGLLKCAFYRLRFDLDDPNLKLLKTLNGTRIYQNLAARPRAWVQAGSGLPASLGTDHLQPVDILSRTPNRILVQIPALQPSREYTLVTSEIAYPGWRRLGRWEAGSNPGGGWAVARRSHSGRRASGRFLIPAVELDGGPGAWGLRIYPIMELWRESHARQSPELSPCPPGGKMNKPRWWLVLFQLPYLPLWLGPLILLAPVWLAGKAMFWGTPSLQFVPWWYWAWQTLRSGHLPLWNPQVGMGAPLLANYQVGLFYPPNWFYFLLAAFGGLPAIAWGQAIMVALHLGWAGIGMAQLARRLGLGRTAQTVSGLAFGLSTYLVARAAFLSVTSAVAWLPWVLLYSREIARPGLNRRAGLLLVICAAFQLLAGHAQTTWYTLLLAGIWTAAWGWFFTRQLNGNGLPVTLRIRATGSFLGLVKLGAFFLWAAAIRGCAALAYCRILAPIPTRSRSLFSGGDDLFHLALALFGPARSGAVWQSCPG